MKKCIIFAGLFLLGVPAVFADSANMGGTGNTVEMMDSSEVQMVDEVITIDVFDGEKESEYGLVGNGYVEVEVLYTFENLTDEAVTVSMGFPEDCGYDCWMEDEDWVTYGGDLWESYKLFDFGAAEADGGEFEVSFVNEMDADTEAMNWYLYDVDFEAGEEKRIVNYYWLMPSSYKTGQWFSYILETGASWRESIESVDIYVNFNGDLSVFDVDQLSPEGYEFDIFGDDGTVSWHFENLEPTEDDNISVSYYPPSYGDFLCAVMPEEYGDGDASSFLEQDGELMYYPCKSNDGDVTTSWVEGAEGDGIGEWVKVHLDEGKEYYFFDILGGYGESESLWEQNNRVKKLGITFSNGYSEEFDLEDVFEKQKFSFADEVNGVSYADLEILEVYEGTGYDDTAIAEVRLYGILADGIEVPESDEDFYYDIAADHVNYEAVKYMDDNGIIDGYPDGGFGPDGEINRAELMKMVVEMMGVDGGEGTGCFPDVNDDWYAPYVCYAYDQGWVDGYPDGTFQPGNYTNRAEAIKMILNAYFEGEIPGIDTLELSPEYHADVPNDASEDEWYYSFVEYAALADVLDLQHIDLISFGYNYFPGENMTRKEVAEMIYRLMSM